MNIGVLGPFPPLRGGIANFNSHLVMNFPPTTVPVPFNYTSQYPRLIFPGTTQRDLSRFPFPIEASPVFSPFAPWQWSGGLQKIASRRLSGLIVPWWTPIFAPSMALYLKLLKGKLNCPVVSICHNVMPHESFPLAAFFQKLLFRHMDAFIVHAKSDQEHLQRWFPQSESLVLYHPLYDRFPDQPDLTREQARMKLGLSRSGKIILFFGLVRPYKGLEVLLQAAQELLSQSFSFSLVVAGEFYESTDKYRSGLASLKERNVLHLYDHYIPNEDVSLFFRAADVVVLPYHHATQSGIIPLAYANGRGVVTTSVGGLPEVVQEGLSGYIVPPGDSAALAREILRFFDNQDTIEAQIPEFGQQFSWADYVSALFSLIEKKISTVQQKQFV